MYYHRRKCPGILDFTFNETSIEHLPSQVLLPASSLLQIQSVREACCKFLLRQLHPSNVLGIRSFAGKSDVSIIELAFPIFSNFLNRFSNFHKFSSAKIAPCPLSLLN